METSPELMKAPPFSRDKARGKNEYQEHKWKVITTGIPLEPVIDHNLIPASELSQVPSPLYLLIPPSPPLFSKIRNNEVCHVIKAFRILFFTRFKSICINKSFSFFLHKDEEEVAIRRIYPRDISS